MSVENDFLPVGTGSGANVEPQATYLTDPQTSQGQQPGIAKSAFNNKALRQGTSIASQFAQYIANTNDTDVLDNLDTAPGQLLSVITAALQILPPSINVFTSGTGTFNPNYYFYGASANATAGAVYKDANGTEFTIPTTFSAATSFQASGPEAPALGTGALTLTKFSGTGDTTITYYAVRAPIVMHVKAVGASAGGNAGGTNGGTAPTSGTNTTFGGFLVAGGATASAGNGFNPAGNGGIATLTTSATVIQRRKVVGGRGQPIIASVSSENEISGGNGASSSYAGAGGGGAFDQAGAAATGPGSGGGGGGAANFGGTGGSAGGEVECDVLNPTSSYPWAVGTAGNGGTGGTTNGGAGINGQLELYVEYQ